MENKLFRYSTEIKIVQSSIKKLNPQFSLCDVLVCYHGDNRNMTSLPKKVIENNLYSIYGVPIIGEWIYKLDGTDEKTWGSHGGRIILDDNGIHFEQTTKPFGFVTKDAADNASWVTITEKDGHTKNEYLKLSGCILWTDRYEESESILEQNYGQSMEIEFTKGFYRDDHYYEAEEFIFSALCILGTEVTPCFESACIGRHYELDSFKKEFSLMLDEYKKFNKEPNNNPKGEQKMELSKFAEVLSTVKIGETEDLKYSLLSVTDNKVFALDLENYKPYGFDYAITTENDADTIVIDFDSKVEMSLSATEKIVENGFSEFNIQGAIDSAVERDLNEKVELCSKELETEFNKKFEELKEHYETLNAKYVEVSEKLETYQIKENEEKAEAHRNEIKNLFDKYAERLGKCSDFLVYKARVDADKVSVDEVQEKLTLMVGKYTMDSQTKKNFSYQPRETKVATKSNELKNRYGNLLDKFIN